MSAQVQAMQKQVSQLRQEANMERIAVSQAIEEMLNFMTQNSNSDSLVLGVTMSENPFRDQKSCVIL